MVKLKICVGCGLPKILDLFDIQANTKDGLRGSCKACTAIRSKKYHAENKEALNYKRKKRKEKAKREALAALAPPAVKKAKAAIDKANIARIKAIMAVPVNVKKTQAYYMGKDPIQKEQEIGV